jgi:hypothetical protein
MTHTAIQRVRFDLRTNDEGRARALHQRISVLARERLGKLLESATRGHGAAQAHYRFERIELDLGVLRIGALEQEIERLLPRALEQWLRRHTPRAQAAAEPDQADMRRALEAMLRDGAAPDQARQLIATAYARCPGVLAELLRMHGRLHAVRARLARLLPDARLGDIVAALEPDQSDVILSYVADVRALHGRRALVPEGEQGFRHAVWEVVLAYLLLECASHFNTKSMIAHTLAQLAARYRLDFAELLRALTACVDAGALPPGRGALPAILLELQGESGARAEPDEIAMSAAARRLEAIAHFLERGVLPWSMQGAAAFGGLFDEALAETPERLAALLRRLGSFEPVRTRLAHQLGRESLLGVVGLLEPSQAQAVVRVIDGVQQAQRRRALVREDGHAFARAVWGFALHHLLVERGSQFNQRSYARSLLRQMAARYGIAYEDLLAAMLADAPAMPPSAPRDALPAILRLLSDELAEQVAVPVRPLGAAARMPLAAAARAVLLRALERGGVAEEPDIARMAGRFGVSAAALRRMVNLARAGHGAPAPVTAILASLHDEAFGQAHREPDAPAAPTHPRFARAAREFVVRGWFEQRGSYFNQRSFIRQLLGQLAQRHGIGYEALLHGLLTRAVPAWRARLRQGAAPSILHSLQAELPVRTAPAPAAHDPALAFLEHGTMPEEGASERWQRLLSRGPWISDRARLLAVLRRTSRREELAERLYDYVPRARLARLLALLSPSLAGGLRTYLLAAEALAGSEQLSAAQRGQAARAHWRAVLLLLLDPGSAHASLARLLEQANRAAAEDLALERQQHLDALYAQARAGSSARFAPVRELLEQAGARPSAPSTAGAAPAPRLGLEGVAAWLRQGASAGQVQPHLEHALAHDAPALRELLLRACALGLERARLAHRLAPAQRERLLELLLGQAAARLGMWRALFAAALAGSSAERERWEGRLTDLLLRLTARAGGAAPAVNAFVAAALAQGTRRSGDTIDALLARLDRQAGALEPARQAAVRSVLEQTALATARTPAPAPAKAPAAERHRVANAGLVLLWPFLDHYFRGLGLLEQGQFAGFGQRCRAAHLLQHLATGALEAPEHDLALNKVLCGLAVETALETGAPPSQAEQEFGAQLLHAVTQRWDKLKNTSAEILRSTFIAREGELTRCVGGWTLHVERGTFDVLLPSLPWPISTVKLSWMEEVLWVHWK